ncbi:MAG: thioredoxin domain-containing protein [Myxococcota bacterium]
MVESPLPGAPPLPGETAAKIRAALAAQGPAYRPRTRHVAGDAPKYTNRLILESSPYLQQHAHNPVNWYAWGDEAFDDARRLGRPVLVSIGYATCHWCHVMEHESFEDEEIARAMNEQYVAVKVDREERPDVDAIYMSAVQQLTGSGGWPLNVFLTSDREPFFGGTYFPPRDGARGARHGWLTVLREIRAQYDGDRLRVAGAAGALTKAVREHLAAAPTPAGAPLPSAQSIEATVQHFKRAFDPVHGGVRRAPKFPSNLPVRLLLRYWRRTGDADALHMARFTLRKMAAGGMYDQLGGGFHRYSTDERWLAPHFEKMLYDNALLAVAYAEAHQATGAPEFARVTREVLDYVLREMTSPEGGFYSATDADSEGVEGKFFVWSAAEIRELLGAEAERFMRHYDVREGGNWDGYNILNVPAPDEAEWAALAGARAKLLATRARRPPPLRDDKVLASWNGLMISAMAVGGRVLGEPRWIEAGVRAASFVLDRMRHEGRLLRSFRDGRARLNAYLDDYAFLGQGLLDLYEATFDPRWLREAVALADAVEARYADREHGGWFMTSDDHEKLLAREKPNYDGAEPSGSSVQLLDVLRLHELTSDDRFRQVAERALRSFAPPLAERPVALTEMLLALDWFTDAPREVVLAWPAATEPPETLLAVLRRTFLPNRVLAGAAEGPPLEALAKIVPLVESKRTRGGRPTAYVCVKGACELPTADPAVFEAQLKKVTPYPAR